MWFSPLTLSVPLVAGSPAMGFIYLEVAAMGYLLGSIPAGYLVGRRHGIDIRQHGSGNIGATNVVRVLGKKPGYFVFFCDMLKGLLAARLGVALALKVHLSLAPDPYATVAGICGGMACILGNNFPVWLRFKGGKGVATTVGVLVGLMPAACLVSAVVWFTTFYLSRYVSLASLLGAAILPPAVWYFSLRENSAAGNGWPMFGFSLVAAALIFWRHRANIGRLLKGTEARFAPKPRPPAAP